MRKWISLVVLLAAGSVALAQQAVAPAAPFGDPERRAKLATGFADIDKILGDYARSVHAPGAAWGIVIDGELAHQGVMGVRDVAAKAPVDADTVFRIASMTKSFTAMSILKLRDAGKLSLDDPAEKYVPELKNLRYPTTDSPRITIRHLLTHSEGFPEDNPWGDQQLSESEAELSRMLREGIPFSNAPGIAYEYSNYGFAILGRIVSRVSGQAYDDYVTDNVLKPLGMTSTTLHPSKVAPNRIAKGYRWEDEQWKEEPALPHGSFGAMGGMLTSIRDLSRYVAAFLEAWPPRDGPETGPVRRASLREMQQPWRPSGMRVALDKSTSAPQLTSTSYGYGLSVTQTCQYRALVAHSGGLPGYGSLMRWLPDYGVGIIAFGNVTYTGWNNAVARGDRSPGPHRRPEPSSGNAVGRARRGARRRIEARRALGRRPGGQDCRGESVPRPIEGPAAQGDRRSPRQGRCLHGPGGLRLRRERAARAMDDELRAWRPAGGDHARADDPARGAVHGGASGAGTAGGCRALCNFLNPATDCELGHELCRPRSAGLGWARDRTPRRALHISLRRH